MQAQATAKQSLVAESPLLRRATRLEAQGIEYLLRTKGDPTVPHELKNALAFLMLQKEGFLLISNDPLSGMRNADDLKQISILAAINNTKVKSVEIKTSSSKRNSSIAWVLGLKAPAILVYEESRKDAARQMLENMIPTYGAREASVVDKRLLTRWLSQRDFYTKGDMEERRRQSTVLYRRRYVAREKEVN
ncbi:MAG TPA: hypothetical protein VMV00_02290 [Candidatus Baltobacteraceae bacterium]|nr:hypothetical protein [Candidatus Baltobacteraceae bacterium]